MLRSLVGSEMCIRDRYETITDTRDGAANFRRKMKDKITETDRYEEAAAHRPSKLYRRKNKEEIS